MPNANNPRGLVPLRDASSGRETGGLEQFAVAAADATALFIGDPVVKTGTADGAGVAIVTRSAAAGPITGVVEGFVPNGTTDTAGYRAASTAAYVLVRTDSSELFEIQDTAGAIVAADIGLNVSMTMTAGSTFTKRSAVTVDGATKAATATLPLKIIGLAQKPGNDYGAFAKLLVKINNSTEATASAGV